MVTARRMADGTLIPATHYRYAGSYEVDPFSPRARYTTECAGIRHQGREIRHGMEDPRAAFSDPWWGHSNQTEIKVSPTVTSGSTTPSARFWWSFGSRGHQ